MTEEWSADTVQKVYGRWLGCIWAECHGLMMEKKDEQVFDCSDCGRRATAAYLEETGRVARNYHS